MHARHAGTLVNPTLSQDAARRRAAPMNEFFTLALDETTGVATLELNRP